MKIKAGNKINLTKKPDCKNRIISQLDNKANFSKILVFINKIVIAALNKKNTITSDGADVR